MLLDKNARKVLKYFIKTNTPQDVITIACNVNLTKVDSERYNLAESTINDLLETDCITAKTENYNIVSYKLTNTGKMYFKLYRENTFYKYWYPVITSSVSLGLSLLIDLLLQ